MVEGDPNMRRPYMEMIANPEKFPNANIEGAKRLSDFLVSDKARNFLPPTMAASATGFPFSFQSGSPSEKQNTL